MNAIDKETKYFRAKGRVEDVKKFYSKCMSYIVFVLVIGTINYYTNWGQSWFYWVVLWWGVGLAFNAIKVFGFASLFSREWEERKINEFMNDDKSADQWK